MAVFTLVTVSVLLKHVDCQIIVAIIIKPDGKMIARARPKWDPKNNDAVINTKSGLLLYRAVCNFLGPGRVY